MKISGDVIRQLVERSKQDLSNLRQAYDYRFMEAIQRTQPDGFATREIVRSNEQKFNDLMNDIEKRKEDAEKFFVKFTGRKNPTLPDITVKCTDISELRKCLTELNNLSLYEWVNEIAKYPAQQKKQLKNILLTPRKRLRLPSSKNIN